jgi:hypothetical protein
MELCFVGQVGGDHEANVSPTSICEWGTHVPEMMMSGSRILLVIEKRSPVERDTPGIIKE